MVRLAVRSSCPWWRSLSRRDALDGGSPGGDDSQGGFHITEYSRTCPDCARRHWYRLDVGSLVRAVWPPGKRDSPLKTRQRTTVGLVSLLARGQTRETEAAQVDGAAAGVEELRQRFSQGGRVLEAVPGAGRRKQHAAHRRKAVDHEPTAFHLRVEADRGLE